MSGIAVLFHRDEHPVQPAQLEAMLGAAPYRGPDGTVCRVRKNVGLGHSLLRVTPEELPGEQPLVSVRTGCIISADARLDNRKELCAALAEKPAMGVSDGELILRAYEAWGTEAARRLDGDFAFVVWDPRTRRLFAARDAAGQRSLFYLFNAGMFAAASEIPSLLQVSPEAPPADDETIREWLVPYNAYRNAKDSPRTFYKGISCLPAGHFLAFDGECVNVTRYWELRPKGEIRYRTNAEYEEHYRQVFFDAVEARLRTDGPVGALLSGGLDSSSVVCAAQDLYRRGRAADHGFRAFSVVFDETDCDERTLIEETSRKWSFPVDYVPSQHCDGRLQLEPQGFQEAPHLAVRPEQSALWLNAYRNGVRAVLTGDTADSCVYGSRLVLDSLLRRFEFKRFARHFQAYRRASGKTGKILAYGCAIPLLPLAVQRWLLATLTGAGLRRNSERLLPVWIDGRLRQHLVERHIALAVDAERHRRFASPSREAEFRLLWPPELARDPVGWPVQVWRPFADRRVQEFLLAIPPDQKFEPHPESSEFYAGAKWLVRRSMQGILPESIRTRQKKTVFTAAMANEIVRHWESHEAAFGPNARPHIAECGYVDPIRFWRRLEQVRMGKPVGDLIYIAHMIALETWLRTLQLPSRIRNRVASPWEQRAGEATSAGLAGIRR